MNWNNIDFLQFKGSFPVDNHVLKIMLRGLQIESPHIKDTNTNFIMAVSFIIVVIYIRYIYIVVIYTLFIIRRMTSSVKCQEEHVLSACKGNSEDKALPFEIEEDWSARKELKIPRFS